MYRRGGRLIRVLAVAAAAAMLVSALPASVATAAKSDCKVHDLAKGIDRASLQRAVSAADPGDALLVQGTCTGTTLIDKSLDISYMGWAGTSMPLGKQYRTDPRGQIRGSDGRPALVIDPSVDGFEINPGLRVSDGIVIDDIAAWQDGAVPPAWERSEASLHASIVTPSLRSCHLRNDETGDEYQLSGAALAAATAGDHLSLRGTCAGESVIDKDLQVTGWRIAISSMQLGGGKVSMEDSGPATLARVIVDDDVASLVLKQLQVTGGFSIKDLDRGD